MTLHPHSDTLVSLLWFSSLQFCLVINTGWFKWSHVCLVPLLHIGKVLSNLLKMNLSQRSTFADITSHESQKIGQCSKVFSLFCYIMLENCEDCIETYSVWTRPTVCPMSMPISYSMLETIINDKLWTLQWKTISCWTWSTAYWQGLDDMG